MSNKTEPCIGQIWSFVAICDTDADRYDETILLIAKNTEGHFEYKTLFGRRTPGQGVSSSLEASQIKEKTWVFDPEAKGSQYWRDKNE